jgi:hypothetical protein
VVVLQRFDPKFRHAPGGAHALSKRKGLYSISIGMTVSAILGGTLMIMPQVDYACIRSSGDFLLAWVVLFPIISAHLTLLAVRPRINPTFGQRMSG